MHKLSFHVTGGETIEFPVEKAICVGYSGRNQDMVKQHIEELAHEGIAPPPSVPMIYPISDILVTQNPCIDVLGGKTSGEVEFVLLQGRDETYVTVGSDHTDRELEGYSIPYAKQATPKPVAQDAWKVEEVIDHWDEIELTCEINIHGQWETYQTGQVSAVMSISDILKFTDEKKCLSEHGNVIFCGTVPILGGTFKYGTEFRLRMHDPVLDRDIIHAYQVRDISV
jgi:2-keto-4-pentenoate hydratase/2-oxohepta-3-ene-1,7-dioic acid hydratase in catechol pathway